MGNGGPAELRVKGGQGCAQLGSEQQVSSVVGAQAESLRELELCKGVEAVQTESQRRVGRYSGLDLCNGHAGTQLLGGDADDFVVQQFGRMQLMTQKPRISGLGSGLVEEPGADQAAIHHEWRPHQVVRRRLGHVKRAQGGTQDVTGCPGPRG